MLEKLWHHPFGILLVGTLAFGMDGFTHAANDEEGEIVQIAPDRDQEAGGEQLNVGPSRTIINPDVPEDRDIPPYWIGIVGGPVNPAVRYQVDIPEEIGLQVLEVVPESPAAKAGLKQHDILLQGNDIQLDEMEDLVELVISEGEKQGQIAVKVLRRGEVESIWVTPVERPATLPAFGGQPQPGLVPGWVDQGDSALQGMLNQLFGGQGQNGIEFHRFGPGVVVGGQQAKVTQLPDGASIKVEKRDNEPTKIVVERDGEKWEIEGEDPESIDQLPDDVKPYVQQLLGNGRQTDIEGFNLNDLQHQVPQLHRLFPGSGDEENLDDRLQAMEQQLRELQKRLVAPAEGEEKAEASH
jgi:membrane-associated protease RseP (regulator of RpoE activity)